MKKKEWIIMRKYKYVLYGFAPRGELEECPNVYLAKDANELYNYISRT